MVLPGKGHKGAKSLCSRAKLKKRGFEGGQMPLQRRFIKRGFKNPNRVEFRTINLAEFVYNSCRKKQYH